MDTNSQVEILESQIRECFGRIVWTHKAQEKGADILASKNNCFKKIQILLAAFVTTGLLLRVFKGNELALIVSTILSAIQFGFTTYLKEYNLGEIVEKHRAAALNLLSLRERYFSLLTNIKANVVTVAEIVEERNNLQKELDELYRGSPRTFSKAYKRASRALKLNEELTFSDAEIDMFLPKELRKTK